jgi:hypothetical protein
VVVVRTPWRAAGLNGASATRLECVPFAWQVRETPGCSASFLMRDPPRLHKFTRGLSRSQHVTRGSLVGRCMYGWRHDKRSPARLMGATSEFSVPTVKVTSSHTPSNKQRKQPITTRRRRAATTRNILYRVYRCFSRLIADRKKKKELIKA